jgi:hypothetical protein
MDCSSLTTHSFRGSRLSMGSRCAANPSYSAFLGEPVRWPKLPPLYFGQLMRFGHAKKLSPFGWLRACGRRAPLAQRGGFQQQLSARSGAHFGYVYISTLGGRKQEATLKTQVVFEINRKKKRVRACAGKSLETATESGRVHAGCVAPRKSRSSVGGRCDRAGSDVRGGGN